MFQLQALSREGLGRTQKEKAMKIDLIVTENASFAAYLFEKGLVPPDAKIMKAATPVDVAGKNVIGDDLPYRLASYALSYTEIPLHLPAELVGQRLVMADYEKYAAEPVVYSVVRKTKKRGNFRYFVELELSETHYPWMDN